MSAPQRNCVIDPRTGCMTCPTIIHQPQVPAIHHYSPNLGWNAGANSLAQIGGNVHAVLPVVVADAGAVIGFRSIYDTSPPVMTNRITHGFYFFVGAGGPRVTVIESGVQRVTPLPVVATDTVELRRTNSQILYFKNGVLIYISAVPSSGTVELMCCLYAGGDQMFGNDNTGGASSNGPDGWGAGEWLDYSSNWFQSVTDPTATLSPLEMVRYGSIAGDQEPPSPMSVIGGTYWTYYDSGGGAADNSSLFGNGAGPFAPIPSSTGVIPGLPEGIMVDSSLPGYWYSAAASGFPDLDMGLGGSSPRPLVDLPDFTGTGADLIEAVFGTYNPYGGPNIAYIEVSDEPAGTDGGLVFGFLIWDKDA